MTDKLEAYRAGHAPAGDTNRIWPLYGAGLESLGRDGAAIDVPLPEIAADA